MSPRRRLGAAIAVAAALLAVAGIAHHAILSFVLARGLGVALGADVRIAGMRVGWTHATFEGIDVRKGGDPLFAAPRIDVAYVWRDLFPGGARRYGLAALVVDSPVFTIVRHADGSTNLGPGGGSVATPVAGPPLAFAARVRDGTLRIVDRAPLEPDLARQSIVGISVDATVRSDARTVVRAAAVLIGRARQTAPLARWPIGVRATIDEGRGYAVARVRVAALPVRGLANFLVHAPIARFDDGVVRDLDVRAYALDVTPGAPIAYRLAGGGRVEGAQIALGPLAKPVRDLRGRFDVFEDGVTTGDLRAEAAGIPLAIRGGLYDFAHPHFRLGIEADPQLAQLRGLFDFLHDQDVRGALHVETLVTSTVDRPLIRTAMSSPRVFYGRMPFDGVSGVVDYQDGAVSFGAFRAGFGPLRLAVAGQLPVDVRDGQLEGAVHIDGDAAALPYTQAVAGGERIAADAIVGGSGYDGFRARGTLAADGQHGSGTGVIAVDQQGRGEFGPFLFARDDGSVLAGGLRLERGRSLSGGWAVLDHYRIDVPRTPAVLPGVDLPGFPPIGGVVDGAIVAGGPPNAFAVAGHFGARRARFAQYPLGTVAADLSGTLADLRLSDIRLDGPAGRFRGAGAVADGTFGTRGTYDGTLEDLRSFTGDIGGHGAVHAPVAALADGRGVTVQTSGAVLRAASIHGVALGSAAGTLVIAGSAVRILTGAATIGGAHAVAAARAGATAVSLTGVPASAFAGSGLPLTAGRVSVFGLADLGHPAFHGSIDLSNGVAMGYPVGGWVDVALAGGALTVHDGFAGLGGTYGRLGGRVAGIGGPDYRYDLDAGVLLGDVGGLVHDLRLPLRTAAGSFAAQIDVRGGAAGGPAVVAVFGAPEGSYNGLAFSAAAGRLSAAPGRGVRVEDGRVTVGSTAATFQAEAGPRGLRVSASSPAADLADFDDYFDESDMLAGRGALSFAFANNGRRTETSGRIALTGARVQRLPLGTVTGAWSTANGIITADLALAGVAGTIHAGGTIVPAAGEPVAALRNARYDADVQASGVDLGTFLPAAGFTDTVLGRVTAAGHVAGVFPHLAIGGHASLAGGQIGAFPIASAEVTTRILGDRVSIDSAQADLGFARFTAGGEVGLDVAAPLSLRVHASVPDLATAARRIAPRRTIDVSGGLEADALITGSFAKPQITAGFDLEKPRYRQLLVQRIIGNLETDLHGVRLDSAEIVLNHGSAVLAGSLPLLFDPAGIGPPDAPISVTADARSVELAALGPLLPGSGTKLTGTVDGHIVVEGTVRSPRVLGSASLTNGSYVSNVETSPIRNASAQLVFSGTSVALQALHADVGSGAVDADGNLNLPIAGAPFQGYAINIASRGAQINVPGFGGGTIAGRAQIIGGARLPTLSGDVKLTNATIPFAAIFRSAGAPPEATGNGPVFDLAFNLTTDAEDVRIKSPIIDAGASGTVLLTGTLRSPRAAGVMTASRGGVFSTYQRLFRIQDATVTFDPRAGIVPDLDLRATAHVNNPDPDPSRNAIGSADITVAVTGPADAYTIGYSSNPSYSQAQIVALLVDLPLLGSLNFADGPAAGTLRGAPGESNALLLPGVTPYETGITPIQEEAFSLLNTQVTQRLVSPLENAFGGAVGLTDLQFTLDYGGRVGYTARQQLSRKREVYATLGQILSYPTRTQIGFQSRPDPATTTSFSYFIQNGSPFYRNSIFGSTSTVQIQNGVQALSDRQGFSLVVRRTYP
jgi:autotransporter translocation and assembly factor TamB